MSRRKQANPKPSKRDSSDQPSLLAANPELPVYLKKFGTESLLLAKEVLKAGTVLGTYKGTTVQESETIGGDTLIKVNRSDGGSPVHVMLEDDGHWLKLMRTATIPTDANICLRISGKDIICTVTKDVNKEVELKVTCRIADPCHEKQFDPTLSSNTHRKSPEASSQVKEVEELEVRETVPKDCTSPKAMLDCVQNSLCTFSDSVACTSSYSIEVSEEKSLKSEAVESDIDMEEFREEVSSSTTRDSPSSDTNREIRIKIEDEAPHLNVKPGEIEKRKSENGANRSPEYEYGNAESYIYDRHSRSHHSPNSSRTTSTPTNPKAFCNACKIQFLSVNTYQVHKKYYCKSRHENEDIAPPVPSSETTTSGCLSAALKSSSDTVILRSGINGNVTSSIIQPQAIYAAISTNPLILLPCTLVPGQGLVPQNGVIPAGTPSIVLQSGIACPTIVEKPSTAKAGDSSCPPRKTSHPTMNTNADETNDKTLLSSTKIATLKRKMSEGDVLNLKKTCTNNDSNSILPDKNQYEPKQIDTDQDSPLDLSIKVKKVNDSSSRKSPMRRRSSVISVGHPSSPGLRIAGTGSPPAPLVISSAHSVPSPTNSYSNESTCYSTQVPVVVHRVPPVESISPLPPVLQSAIVDKTIPPPGMMPPKLMKQGNNICEECHIVFIKYDNLVTHKKHYCAYRRQQLSAMAAAAAAAAASTLEQSSDDNNSNHSDGTQNFQNEDNSKSNLRKIEYGIEHYRPVIPKPPQPAYCCDACGVKFSTSDTLIAHQTYYCMKKPDSAMSKASNKKGDDSNSTIDSPFSGPEEWKCNFCEAACSSYETMRRHLLTHTEPRGYRCLLCGYKGNTLRGMRTHAGEHLTEDSTSVEEFMSTTVISEGGGLPIIPRTVEYSDEDSDVQKESSSCYIQRERTSSNNSDVLSNRTLKVADLSESEEHSCSPRRSENSDKEIAIKTVCSIKTESNDSSSDINGNQETVNPLAFCDVVIKSETDQNGSGDDSDRVEVKKEADCDSDELSSVTSHPQSVIRIAEKQTASHSSKRKNKQTPKPGSDPKLCKACGVSFQHWSNFLTHKKFYCDSRTLPNCLPEAATVQ